MIPLAPRRHDSCMKKAYQLALYFHNCKYFCLSNQSEHNYDLRVGSAQNSCDIEWFPRRNKFGISSLSNKECTVINVFKA